MADAINLLALKSFRFGGEQKYPGDAFLATPREARLLIAIGRAVRANETEPEVPSKPTLLGAISIEPVPIEPVAVEEAVTASAPSDPLQGDASPLQREADATPLLAEGVANDEASSNSPEPSLAAPAAEELPVASAPQAAPRKSTRRQATTQ